MSEKVVLTQEQAEAIERLVSIHESDTEKAEIHRILIGEKLSCGWRADHLRAANTIDDLVFIDALRIGYEVEKPKFQVGDKVTWDGLEEVLVIGKIYSVDRKLSCSFEESAGCCLLDGLRHATPEEIYWLHELGRDKVGDFREGDVIITQEVSYRYSMDGEVDTIGPETTKLWMDQGIIKGIYPVESFKPMKGDN